MVLSRPETTEDMIFSIFHSQVLKITSKQICLVCVLTRSVVCLLFACTFI